jgi:hypothetical protein
MGRTSAVAVLTALLLIALSAPASAEPTTFFPAQYLDQTFPGGEPVVQVDTIHHTIVYSSHEGTTHLYRNGLGVATLQWISEYRNQTKMWVSKDGGATFERINFLGSGFATDPTKNTGFSDPDFAIDQAGRVYNTGINLANDALFSSGDGGFTWDKGTVFCNSSDRPWLAAGEPDHAWMSVNENVGGHSIYESTDGGNSCGSKVSSPGGVGKIYYDHANKVLIEPARSGGKLGINVIPPGGPSTFKGGPAGNFYAHWPAIAQDGAGTTYLVWDTDETNEAGASPCGGAAPAPNTIKMAYTKDLGTTWSDPITIAAPPGVRVFWPWVFAGDAGKVSIVWYQTDKLVDVACEPSKLSIYHATVLNATDAAKRSVETVDAVGRPISEAADICQSGTTCVATGEDRRLGDFFTNAIDERGCAVIASGDTMIKDPTGGERSISAPLYIRQATGPRLIGKGNCSGTVDPVPAGGGTGGGGKGGQQPPGAGVPLPSNRRCTSRRRFEIRLREPKGQTLVSAKVYVNGKQVKVRRKGGRLRAIVDLRRLKKRRYTVKIVATTGQGRQVVSQRRYRTCTPKRKR